MTTRNTIQRSLVLDTVRELRCHATADEIYHRLVRKYPTISRGTVYRNLTLLSETGEIRKVSMSGGADRYDHQCSAHYHARCVECGRVSDVDMEVLADLEQRIVDAQGFHFTGHDVVFKGVCRECHSRLKKGTIAPAEAGM